MHTANEPFKLPNPIWLLLALIAIFFLASCGVVNKSKKTVTTSIDSSGVTTHNESTIQSQDSTGAKEVEKSSEDKQTVDSSNSINIQFDNTDSSSKPTGPVTIKADNDGNVVVDPGGRSIKSITGTRKKSTSQTKTVKEINTDSGRVVRTSTAIKNDSSQASIKKKSKTENTHTFKLPSPWWLLLLLIPLAVWRFWPIIKKAIFPLS